MARVDEVFARMRTEVSNWYTAGILATIVMATRVPPRKGMAGTWLGRHVMTFRMRDGVRITCRLQDSGDWISVYLDRDYIPFPIAWGELRTILDIGATTGCFTAWAQRRSPQAHIVAVEPNPAVFGFLVQNLAANRTNALPMHVAVGARPGYGEVLDRSFSVLARVVETDVQLPTTVRIATLEDILDESGLGECDLMKIDIEGAEFDVLLSASAITLNRIKTILCEFHPVRGRSVEDLVRLLTTSGFLVTISGGPVGFLFATKT
jgi:FkbM family methyltransferase